jgi:hypothetical protein
MLQNKYKIVANYLKNKLSKNKFPGTGKIPNNTIDNFSRTWKGASVAWWEALMS